MIELQIDVADMRKKQETYINRLEQKPEDNKHKHTEEATRETPGPSKIVHTQEATA